MNDIMQETISDDVSRARRRRAALALVENIATEDIELLNERFPRLAESALHEILNPSACCICDTTLPMSPKVCIVHKSAGLALAKREHIHYSEAAGRLYWDARDAQKLLL